MANKNNIANGSANYGANNGGMTMRRATGGANYGVEYPVDIVLCIDVTGSMMNRDLLEQVKSRAVCFYDDLLEKMKEKGKKVKQVRVRIIAFRDYLSATQTGYAPMQTAGFFDLPEQASDFRDAVESMEAVGGSFDDPEDALEALAYAMNSEWTMDQGKHRHIIVLWSDEIPHDLGHGKASPKYPQDMAKNMQELGDWWGSANDPGKMPDQHGKRLVLYAPDRGHWHTIAHNWDKVVMVPSKAGEGMGKETYDMLLDIIANSI